MLKERVGVYVNDSQRARHLAERFTEAFGGCTILLGNGLWLSSNDEIMFETVYYVFSYAIKLDRQTVVNLARVISEKLNDQEAIAMQINDALLIESPSELPQVIEKIL